MRISGKGKCFSPPNTIWGSQSWDSDGPMTSPQEAELKINPPREEGMAGKGRGQLRPELMMASSSTVPEASLVLDFSFSWASVSLLFMFTLVWMFYDLKRTTCSFYLWTKSKLPLILFVGQIPQNSTFTESSKIKERSFFLVLHVASEIDFSGPPKCLLIYKGPLVSIMLDSAHLLNPETVHGDSPIRYFTFTSPNLACE